MSALKHLALAIYNPVMHFYRRRFLGLSHQRQDAERTRQKWRLIEGELDTPPGSLLDIGCNEGYFALKAAEKGWCAWGIDRLGHTVAYADKKARDGRLSTAYFARGLMSPATARTLPKFDVILLLSAFHEIYQSFDEEDAYRLFDDLLKACGRKLIFEPASINNRYSRERAVLAKDNDRDAIEAWVRDLASRSPGWHVRYVGETSYTADEPYRYMFVIESAAGSSAALPFTETGP